MALATLAIRDGAAAPQKVPVHVGAGGEVITTCSLDTGKPQFRYAAVFTPFATGALVVWNVKGSASKTVRIKRLSVSGFSTAAGSELFEIIRASSEGANGTKVPITPGQMDSAHTTAATAVVNAFTTAAQTAGTAVAVLGAANVQTTAAAGNGGTVTEFIQPGEAIVLRGVADFLELKNLNGGNLAAGTQLAVTMITEEDAS